MINVSLYLHRACFIKNLTATFNSFIPMKQSMTAISGDRIDPGSIGTGT